jgi:hypothetical protein
MVIVLGLIGGQFAFFLQPPIDRETSRIRGDFCFLAPDPKGFALGF